MPRPPVRRADLFSRVGTLLSTSSRDPQTPITDVQWILGHVHLSTTQIYVRPTADDVVQSALAHHRRQAGPKPPAARPAPGYRAETLRILFGGEPR